MSKEPFDQSTHLPRTLKQPALAAPSIEVKSPVLFKIFSLVIIAGGGVLFIGWPIVRWVNSPVPNTLSVILANLFAVVLGTWFVLQGAVRMWHESNLALWVDDVGITMHLGTRITKVNWHQVQSLTVDAKNEKGKSGWWITLRDEQGHALLQWDRNWCNTTSSSLKKCDQLVQFIETKLQEQGHVPESAAAVWQEISRSHNVSTRPLQVRATSVKGIGWVCIVFFLFCAVMAWRAGQGEVSPWFLIFVAMGVFLLLITGPLEIDSHVITYITPLGRYQIRWDEVKKVEIDHQGGGPVFRGDNRRLATLGPEYWSGPDKGPMYVLLMAQIEERKIEMDQTARAAYTLSKNTKVR